MVGGALIGGGLNLVKQLKENDFNISKTAENFKGGEFAASTISGASFGLAIGSGAALAVGARGAAAAVIGARNAGLTVAGSLVAEGIDDGTITPLDVAGAVVDAATAKLGGALMKVVDDVPAPVGEAVTTGAKGATDEIYEQEAPPPDEEQR